MASQIVGDGASLEWISYVRGHHVYCQLGWTPVIGELLTLKRQPDNGYDNYAVAVVKNEDVVGHIPKTISRLVSHFLMKDGHSAFCEHRVNRGVQLGVEVPCIYRFYGRQSYLDRLNDLYFMQVLHHELLLFFNQYC